MIANYFTLSGVKVNLSAQVLDLKRRPMLGLYAAGEMMGVYHRTYIGSTSTMPGCMFSRLQDSMTRAPGNRNERT